jgi:hypothetical protein
MVDCPQWNVLGEKDAFGLSPGLSYLGVLSWSLTGCVLRQLLKRNAVRCDVIEREK